MEKRLFLTCILLLLTTLGFVQPVTVLAARTFITNSEGSIAADDKVILEVRLDTEGQTVNTVEGLVGLTVSQGNLYIRNIGLGGSELELWPNKPSVTSQSQNASVSFVGGKPGGFNSSNALLFTIALTVSEPGSLAIAPASIVAYAHDGHGTPVSVRTTDAIIQIEARRETPRDYWQENLEADHEPPLPFRVEHGQDPSVFNGKRFISFFTTDAQSGIDHYEVQEGDRAAVRSSSPYVLQEQGLSLPVTVYAFDKAGNVREARWTPANQFNNTPLVMILLSLILIILLLCCIIIWQWPPQNKTSQRKTKHRL